MIFDRLGGLFDRCFNRSFDVVVDAFNAPKGKEEMHQTSLSHLIEILRAL